MIRKSPLDHQEQEIKRQDAEHRPTSLLLNLWFTGPTHLVWYSPSEQNCSLEHSLFSNKQPVCKRQKRDEEPKWADENIIMLFCQWRYSFKWCLSDLFLTDTFVSAINQCVKSVFPTVWLWDKSYSSKTQSESILNQDESMTGIIHPWWPMNAVACFPEDAELLCGQIETRRKAPGMCWTQLIK